MKLKVVVTLLIIMVSLIPLDMLYQYLEQKMRPSESFGIFYLENNDAGNDIRLHIS